jgi:prepilin-type N-terminal cleavage/methylation domain-containing protein
MMPLNSTPTNAHRTTAGFTLVEIMAAIVIITILAVITLSIGSALLEKTERRRTLDVLQVLDAAVVEYQTTIGRRMTYGHSGEPLGNVLLGDFDAWQGSSYDIEHLNGVLGFADPLSGNYPTGTVPESGTGSYRRALGGEAPYRLWEEFTRKLSGVSQCRSILSNADDDLIEVLGTDNFSDVVQTLFRDAWGSPILIVFPGRDVYVDRDGSGLPGEPGQQTLRDEDGTIRTRAEIILGPGRNKRVYFVSAGPDRRFGDLDYQLQVGELWEPDREDVNMRRTDDNIFSYEVRTW